MAALKGLQLALLPDVKPYWLENPGRPQPEPFCSGGDKARSPCPAQMALELPEAAPNACTIAQDIQRRHSPKGKAVGWIKERQGNTKRKKPTTSYFYCWDEPVKKGGQAEYQRHQVYVPVRAIARVQEMLAERQPVAVVLGEIEGAKAKK
jgi:hypothetical protein